MPANDAQLAVIMARLDEIDHRVEQLDKTVAENTAIVNQGKGAGRAFLWIVGCLSGLTAAWVGITKIVGMNGG